MHDRTAILFALTCACHPAPPRQLAATEPIRRTLLVHRDVAELPGWETRLYLIEYEAGVAAPIHHHPFEGIGYVISGRFESAFRGEPPITVGAGESFRDRAGVEHVLFRNLDAAPLRFVISYVMPKDAPTVETP